jgi:hypothetical protein
VPSGGLSPGSRLAILTEAHDELASFSITSGQAVSMTPARVRFNPRMA